MLLTDFQRMDPPLSFELGRVVVLQDKCREELPFVADAEAPASCHDVVDVPAKAKDRDQSTKQRECDPDPHPPLMFGGRYLQRTPFADLRLHPRRCCSVQVEVAEDLRHRTNLLGAGRAAR